MARKTLMYLACVKVREKESSFCFRDSRKNIRPATTVMLGVQMVGNRANVETSSKCYQDNFDSKGD